MPMTTQYSAAEPSRETVDSLAGPTLIEFGTPWCGFCLAAQPLLASAMQSRQDVQHIKIEDGRGRRLGRSFGVKLWPTLVFLRDGKEVARLVRPESAGEIARALDQIEGRNAQ